MSGKLVVKWAMEPESELALSEPPFDEEDFVLDRELSEPGWVRLAGTGQPYQFHNEEEETTVNIFYNAGDLERVNDQIMVVVQRTYFELVSKYEEVGIMDDISEIVNRLIAEALKEVADESS